jgi:hypothetical protein
MLRTRSATRKKAKPPQGEVSTAEVLPADYIESPSTIGQVGDHILNQLADVNWYSSNRGLFSFLELLLWLQ